MAGHSRAMLLSQPRRVEHLLEALTATGNVASACGAARIARRCFYSWSRRGEAAITTAQTASEASGEDYLEKVSADDLPYVEFVLRAEEARSTFVSTCLGEIVAATPKSWQAAAWLLERQFPNEYALHTARFAATDDGNTPTLIDDISDRLDRGGDPRLEQLVKNLAAAPEDQRNLYLAAIMKHLAPVDP